MSVPPTSSLPARPNEPRRRLIDPLMSWAAWSAAVLILLNLAMLVGVLVNAALPSIQRFGLSFFTTSEWRPNELQRPQRDAAGKIVRDEYGETVMIVSPPVYGALPVIYGTAVSSAIALVLAVPLSFGTAIFLVRIAPRWLVQPVGFLVEFLAAIPSIAYGIFGLFVLAPLIQNHVRPLFDRLAEVIPTLRVLVSDRLPDGTLVPLPISGQNMLTASLILAVMIVPIITAISRDVLANIPRAQVEGTLALGATWWQSCVEMLRFGRSALFGAVILGLARAAGETMAVAMVIGNANRIEPSPFAPAQTMASLLANEFAEATSSLQRGALVEVALVLLIMSLLFNVIARYLVVGKDSRSAMAH